jgi:hypothetical protein
VNIDGAAPRIDREGERQRMRGLFRIDVSRLGDRQLAMHRLLVDTAAGHSTRTEHDQPSPVGIVVDEDGRGRHLIGSREHEQEREHRHGRTLPRSSQQFKPLR